MTNKRYDEVNEQVGHVVDCGGSWTVDQIFSRISGNPYFNQYARPTLAEIQHVCETTYRTVCTTDQTFYTSNPAPAPAPTPAEKLAAVQYEDAGRLWSWFCPCPKDDGLTDAQFVAHIDATGKWIFLASLDAAMTECANGNHTL